MERYIHGAVANAEGQKTYHDADNTDRPNNFNSTYSKSVSSNLHYRTDFALCSKGGDGKWDTRPSTSGSSDVTNFFPDE